MDRAKISKRKIQSRPHQRKDQSEDVAGATGWIAKLHQRKAVLLRNLASQRWKRTWTKQTRKWTRHPKKKILSNHFIGQLWKQKLLT